MKKPELIPPCSGWQEDLPHPDEIPAVIPDLGFDAPNFQNGVFLELPRAFAFLRGCLIWLVPVIYSYVVIFFMDNLFRLEIFKSRRMDNIRFNNCSCPLVSYSFLEI